jgi:nitrogen fixation NifU-like protein
MDLRALYEEVILDHNRNPRNYGERPAGASQSAEGHNPLCGDHIAVHLQVDKGVITEVKFEGDGCAISTASASLMTEAVKGKSEDDANELFREIHDALLEEGSVPDDAAAALGKLAVLLGVKDFPMRVKCATLPWHTLQAALKDTGESVTTE